MNKPTFALSINPSIINKDAKNGCQRGFEFHSDLTIDSIKESIHKGHAIAAAQFKDEYRLNANFVRATVLALDFDNSQKQKTAENTEVKVQSNTFTIEQAVEHPFVKQHAFYGYTSFSHTDDWHKFRLCFLLPFEIIDQHQYKAIVRHIATKYLQGADMTATSASNIFFGNTNAIDIIDNPLSIAIPDEVIIEALEQCQVEANLREERKAQSEQASLRRRAELLASGREDDTDKMVDIALTYVPPRIIGDGTYENARDVCWALTAHYGVNTAITLMERHSPSYGTWDATEVCESYESGRGDGIKGIGTLFAIAGKFGFKQSDHRESRKTTSSAKSINRSVATTLIPVDILKDSIASVDEDDKEIRHVTDNEVEEFQELAALKGTKFDPRKFLPKELAEAFIADAAKQNIDPVSFMAYLLPCVSSLMGKVTLDLGGGFKVPNIIWSMLVQRSGGGKTRAADIFTAQLLEWEGESRAKYQDDLKVYKKQVRQQTKDDEEIPLPKNRKFLFGVATPQAVVRRFADQEDNGCIWVRDEIKGLFGGLSQFTKGEGEGVEIVLETWGGNALPVDRVNNDTDSFFVSTSRMSMCGGIQPAIVPKVFDPKDPQGVGARMLPVLPSDSYSKRNKENIKLPSLLSKLYFDVKESARIDNETNRTNDWDGITLSDEADDYFTPVYEYFANLRSNNSAVDAWQSKANNHIGRVAFVLHAIHCVYDKSLDRKRISKDILEKAHNYILIIRDWVKQMSGEMVSETSPTMPAILNKIVSYAERVNKPLAMSDIYRNVYGIKQLAKQEKVGDTEFTYSLCKELVALGKGVFSTSIKNKPLFNAIATCSEHTSTEIAIKIDSNTDSNRDTENHCSKSNDSTEINHEENTIEDIDTSKAEIIMRGNDTLPNIVINPPMEDRNDARIAQDSIPDTVLVDLYDDGSALQVAINVLCPNEKSDIDHTIQVGSKVVCPTSTDGDPWSGAIAEVLEITNNRAKLFNSDFTIPTYKDLSVLTLVNEAQSNG